MKEAQMREARKVMPSGEHHLNPPVTWTDAWELWLAFIVAAPYPQQVQAWNMLQISASRVAGVDRSSRVQWPHAFQYLTPEAVMAVIEELG